MLGWEPQGFVPSALDFPHLHAIPLWVLAQVRGPTVVALGCLGNTARSHSPVTPLPTVFHGGYYLLLQGLNSLMPPGQQLKHAPYALSPRA